MQRHRWQVEFPEQSARGSTLISMAPTEVNRPALEMPGAKVTLSRADIARSLVESYQLDDTLRGHVYEVIRRWHRDAGLRPEAAIADNAFLDYAPETISWLSPVTTLLQRRGRIHRGTSVQPQHDPSREARRGSWLIKDAASFHLAAIRIAVVEIEQRALRVSADMTGPSTSRPTSDRVSIVEAIAEELDKTLRNDPPLPAPGQDYVQNYHRPRFFLAPTPMITDRLASSLREVADSSVRLIIEAPVGTGKSAAAAIYAAFLLGHAETRRAMNQSRTVVDVSPLYSVTGRDRVDDA